MLRNDIFEFKKKEKEYSRKKSIEEKIKDLILIQKRRIEIHPELKQLGIPLPWGSKKN